METNETIKQGSLKNTSENLYGQILQDMIMTLNDMMASNNIMSFEMQNSLFDITLPFLVSLTEEEFTEMEQLAKQIEDIKKTLVNATTDYMQRINDDKLLKIFDLLKQRRRYMFIFMARDGILAPIIKKPSKENFKFFIK